MHLITGGPQVRMEMIALTGVLALAMALIHILAGRLHRLGGARRSWWLSAAGGTGVAYVFVLMLPEISRAQEFVARTGGFSALLLERHIYLTALVGLVAFYGLERSAKVSRRTSGQVDGTHAAGSGVFRLHLISFGLYNALVGYLLLHREQAGLLSLLLFWFALSLHLLINDYELLIEAVSSPNLCLWLHSHGPGSGSKFS